MQPNTCQIRGSAEKFLKAPAGLRKEKKAKGQNQKNLKQNGKINSEKRINDKIVKNKN